MARITPDTPQRGAARNLLNVVDTYYQPARDRAGEAAMAQGFQVASQVAGELARQGMKENVEEAKVKAKADVAAGNDPDEELKQVRLGNLFRPHSKAYNMVYAEAMGRKAAIEFNENMVLEYEKSGLKESTDPNRFREWMNGKVNTFLKDPAHQNTYFLAGAVPTVQQQTVNMGAAHMSNVSAQMERNHLASIQKQADELAMSVARGEVSLEKGLESLLSNVVGKGYATGLTGSSTRKAGIASWLTAADAAGDTEMLQALMDAQKRGDIKLTPDELNTVKDQSMNIERDINFRKEQEARVAKAQREAEVNAFEDTITDVMLNNPSLTLPQFLAMPSSDEPNAPSMADVIRDSPNSTEIMKKSKAAYETLNKLHDDIGATEEQLNNLAITEFVEQMDPNKTGDLLSFLHTLQENGVRINEANKQHAFAELAKLRDPESVHNSQTYKDFKKSTVQRVIQSLTVEPDKLARALNGEYVGGQSETIKMQFQTYLDEEIAQLTGRSPAEIKEAIMAAERSVMEFYQQNNPELFDKVYNAYSKEVKEGNIGQESNPFFAEEYTRRVNQATSLLVNSKLRPEDSGYGARRDIDLQAADAVLHPPEVEEDTVTVYDPKQAEIAAQVAQAEADQAARDAEKAAQVEAEKAAKDAEEKAKLDEDAALIEKAKVFVEQANEFISSENADWILSKMIRAFNLTNPTNYDELEYLIEDLSALQEEAEIEINPEKLQLLIASAIERFQ